MFNFNMTIVILKIFTNANVAILICYTIAHPLNCESVQKIKKKREKIKKQEFLYNTVVESNSITPVAETKVLNSKSFI